MDEKYRFCKKNLLHTNRWITTRRKDDSSNSTNRTANCTFVESVFGESSIDQYQFVFVDFRPTYNTDKFLCHNFLSWFGHQSRSASWIIYRYCQPLPQGEFFTSSFLWQRLGRARKTRAKRCSPTLHLTQFAFQYYSVVRLSVDRQVASRNYVAILTIRWLLGFIKTFTMVLFLEICRRAQFKCVFKRLIILSNPFLTKI